ncbi:MAG: hypothetical protein WDA68_11300 [Phycisphaerae bacterium]
MSTKEQKNAHGGVFSALFSNIAVLVVYTEKVVFIGLNAGVLFRTNTASKQYKILIAWKRRILKVNRMNLPDGLSWYKPL